MKEVVLWLLLVTSGSNSSTVVVDRFVEQKECRAVLATIERLSNDKAGMSYVRGVCVEAKVARDIKP